MDGEVLHPPAPRRDYRCDGYGDYLFAPSRLTPLKRMDLILRRSRDPKPAAPDVDRRRGRAAGHARAHGARPGHVDHGVCGRVSESELVDHLARCRAVVFVPHDEDYGFVTVEAFAAAKPVITCQDSGGPLELVRDGENGWIVPPTPADVARAMAAAMDSPGLAERMGQQGS